MRRRDAESYRPELDDALIVRAEGGGSHLPGSLVPDRDVSAVDVTLGRCGIAPCRPRCNTCRAPGGPRRIEDVVGSGHPSNISDVIGNLDPGLGEQCSALQQTVPLVLGVLKRSSCQSQKGHLRVHLVDSSIGCSQGFDLQDL